MRNRLSAFACCLLLTVCCLLTAAAPIRADIKLTLDTKEGDSISDVAKIVAHAESGDNIDKVEFYVDDQLRFTAPSVPYTFSWDTIPDKEGTHTLGVTAFDGNGQTKKLSITVKIDNELGLGASALAQKGADALKANDLPTALKYSRRALKAEPGNPEGSRLLAGIYAGQNDWAKAIATLEKSNNVGTDPNTMLALATYKMRYASDPTNADSFFPTLDSVYELRQKAADLHVAAVTKQNAEDTSAAHEAIGDALLAAGHPGQAELEYRKAGGKDNAPASSVSRYALAKLYQDQPKGALDILHIAEVNGTKPDPAMRAVRGMAYLWSGDYEAARAAVAGDLAAEYPAALYVAAYVDMAAGKTTLARTEIDTAAKTLPNSPETYYGKSMTALRPEEQDAALRIAISLAPFQSALYLDLAARTALEKVYVGKDEPASVRTQKLAERYERATKYLDFVLKHDPENVNARVQKALLLLQTNHLKEAGTLLSALAKTGEQSPDVLSALATYWQLAHNESNSKRYTEAAKKADKARFNREISLDPLELLADLDVKLRYRMGFFLTPSTLYPAQPVAVTAP